MSVLCLLFVLVKRTVMTISINLQLYVQLMNNEQTSDNVGTLGQHIIRKWGDKEWVCNMLDHVISMHSSNIYILEGWISSHTLKSTLPWLTQTIALCLALPMQRRGRRRRREPWQRREG